MLYWQLPTTTALHGSSVSTRMPRTWASRLSNQSQSSGATRPTMSIAKLPGGHHCFGRSSILMMESTPAVPMSPSSGSRDLNRTSNRSSGLRSGCGTEPMSLLPIILNFSGLSGCAVRGNNDSASFLGFPRCAFKSGAMMSFRGMGCTNTSQGQYNTRHEAVRDALYFMCTLGKES